MIDFRKYLSEAGREAAVRKRTTAPPPGVYPDTPMEDYLSWDLLSASALAAILTQGAAYADWSRGFKLGDRPALQLGTAGHAAILEPEHFEDRFQLRETKGEGVRGRMKALEGAGVTLCTQAQLDAAACMAAQVQAHSRASKLLSRGERELAVIFDLELQPSEGSAIEVRGKLRLDLLRRDLRLAVDIKTARDISPRALSRSFYEYGYDIGKAWYEKGLAAAGIEVDTYTYVAIENELPHRVRLFELGQASTDLGRLRLETALELWADCVQADFWPGDDEAVRPLEMPQYAFDAWSDRAKGGQI